LTEHPISRLSFTGVGNTKVGVLVGGSGVYVDVGAAVSTGEAVYVDVTGTTVGDRVAVGLDATVLEAVGVTETVAVGEGFGESIASSHMTQANTINTAITIAITVHPTVLAKLANLFFIRSPTSRSLNFQYLKCSSGLLVMFTQTGYQTLHVVHHLGEYSTVLISHQLVLLPKVTEIILHIGISLIECFLHSICPDENEDYEYSNDR
jgi:hypothetical protein